MAIYRSDQAVVTFGTEAAPGGYPELAYPSEIDPASAGASVLNGAHPAGSRSISVDDGSNFAIGDYIAIGYTEGSETGEYNSEIRRVVATDMTSDKDRLFLDVPTGFHHIDNVTIKDVDTAPTAGTPVVKSDYPAALSNTGGVSSGPKYTNAMRFVPGIYETIEVGDMETTYNPVYTLGSTAKRSPTFIYRGEQSFSGAISGMTLLNGWPLRYGIGKVTTVPSDPTATDSNAFTSGLTLKKGDQVINLNDAGLYGAIEADNATAGNNQTLLYITDGAYTVNEVVQVYKKITSNVVFLTHPLRFDHIASSSNTVTVSVLNKSNDSRTYTHTIAETSDLDSVAINVHLRDSGETAANDFNRRYYGGHIGTSVIAAEEQGLVTTSWDGIQFMGMVHNQQYESGFGGSGAQKFLPRHAFMKTISDTEAWVPSNGITSAAPLGVPASPYYFSQGTIKLYGVPIATIRNFSLTINNNPEARYYIGSNAGQRQRGPYEIVNQRRDYSMSMTVVEPTSRAVTEEGSSALGYERGGSSIFKQMLMEGDAGELTTTTPEGLAFEIQFSRDDLGTGSSDYIKIEPDYASGTAAPAVGLNKQGMFISSAKYNLDGSSPIQADLDILLRSVKITIVDTTAVYP